MLVSTSENKLGTWEWLFHIAGLLVTLAAIAAIVMLVLCPIDKRHAAVLRNTNGLRKVLDLEDQLRDEHQRLTQSLMLADVQIDQLLQKIPNVPRQADFLGQITTLAHEVGLEIVDYRPGDVVQMNEYKEMTVTMSSEGSYAGICSFLKRLSQLPRLSRVNELTISPQRQEAAYSMDMTLAIFFAPTNDLERRNGNG